MYKNPSSVVLDIGWILELKLWEVWKIPISMLDARLIKSKLWVGNPGPSIFFTVILLLCLFLNSIFKKFPGYFQCAAKIENPVLGDSGHWPVWKPLFLRIHQDCFFSLNVPHPESTFCLFPLLLFFLSFHFV